MIKYQNIIINPKTIAFIKDYDKMISIYFATEQKGLHLRFESEEEKNEMLISILSYME